MFGAFFVLLVGFQLKHFIADYLLQASWMIAEKGKLTSPGGYVHAGIHVLGPPPICPLGSMPVA